MENITHQHFIDKLALLNGVVSGVALYPQVFSVLMNGSAEGISFVSFLIIFLNSIIWVFYAIHRGLISLGIASLLNAIASAVLIVAIALY